MHSRDWRCCRVAFEHACSMMNGETQVVNSTNNNNNSDCCSNSTGHRAIQSNYYELICVFPCDTMRSAFLLLSCDPVKLMCLLQIFHRNFENESETRPFVRVHLIRTFHVCFVFAFEYFMSDKRSNSMSIFQTIQEIWEKRNRSYRGVA